MVKLVIHLDHDDIVLSGLRRKTADGLKRLYCPAHTALIHREGLAFGRIMMISGKNLSPASLTLLISW